ncbi:hypothetical protein [Pelagicoccus sp. SDUM812003]|uniref:hypothetical protein n=1 Tax=Pelagicoccus sp. SDUM812003 TaxID=3041267 RepID=UPI00280EBD57|nr:hypothetical protein [Pelagicoccus sp. SDUM812003]MDQ8201540.1 hypothetical protein [Pelagicoccus sp. SDUM812003]
MTLLASYEVATRRESISLKEGNLEELKRAQDKKAKLLRSLSSETLPAPDQQEKSEFNARLRKVLEQESENARLLSERLAENRSEYRKLGQNAVSANKFKRVYARSADSTAARGTLKGKA